MKYPSFGSLLALWLTLSSSLLAGGIIKDIEIFKRTDRVDVLFTFEQSFNETISQKDGAGYRTVVLKNTVFEGVLEERVDAMGIEEVKIFGQGGDLYLMVIGPKIPAITASKAANGFGLRIRIKEMEGIKPSNSPKRESNALALAKTPATNSEDSAPPASGIFDGMGVETFSYNQYLAMIGILILSLALLLFWRKRTLSPSSKRSQGSLFPSQSWLFKSKTPLKEEIEIISQKPLDIKNRFVTIESHGYRYLILIGATGNTLIDRYPIGAHPSKEIEEDYVEGESFERLLERKRDHLLHYLNSEDRKLEDFKEKASRY